MRRVAAGAVAAIAAVAAGCGSGERAQGVPEGAAKAPADAVAFVSLRTNRASAQWKRTTAVMRKLPAGTNILESFDEARGAIGPETDVVWLDFADGGGNHVILTKPSDLARLKMLAAPDNFRYATLSGGWVAIGDQADVYKNEVKGEKLDGDKGFKHAFAKLDESAEVRAWVRGTAVQDALDRTLAREGAAPRITHEAGNLRALAASARAEAGGVRFDIYGVIEPPPAPATFARKLPDLIPADAILYVGATRLDVPTRLVLRMVADSKPRFRAQLEQVESVLGVTLEGDIYPLLERESALVVSPYPRFPSVMFVQKVADQTKADAVLRRLGAVAQVSGAVAVEPTRIEGVYAQQLTFRSQHVTVYAGVAHGMLYVTNARRSAADLIAGPRRPPLARDARFRFAWDRAKAPSKVAAFAYGDVSRGVPFVFDLVRRRGATVPPAVVANAKAVDDSLLYLVPDDDGLRLSGFTAIK